MIVLAETKAHIPEEFHIGDTWHRYRVVKLWQQDPAPLLEHQGLWPFAVLARAAQPQQLLMEVAEKVSTITDENRRSDLTAAVSILAGLRFKPRFVNRLFRKEIMMQSAIYREILAEGELIGEKRGEQRGEHHGRLAVIARQLNRRIGVIPRRMQANLEALSLLQLDALSEALLDFQSVEDLAHWLQSQQP